MIRTAREGQQTASGAGIAVNSDAPVVCRTCDRPFVRAAWNQKDCEQCKGPGTRLKHYFAKHQLELELERTARSKRHSLSERYSAWRTLNPHIYDLFRRFALEALQSGQRIGAKAIAERIRWEVRIRYRGEFKINNSFVSRMARELIESDERFSEWFETRRLRA